MQPVEHDSLAIAPIHNSQADAGLAEQALADFAKSQQLSRKNAAQLIFGHDQAAVSYTHLTLPTILRV